MLPYQPKPHHALTSLYNNLGNVIKTHIAFVDPFCSAAFLSQKCKAAGIQTSAIYTLIDLSNEDFAPIQPNLFDQVFYISNQSDLSNTASLLSKMNVNFIFYGSELSIQVTDILANILTPNHANCLTKSLARSDKYLMHEHLHKEGVPALKQIKVHRTLTKSQEQEITAWQFPLIVKAVNNFDNLMGKVCHTLQEVIDFLRAQIEINIFGHMSPYHLIQEYSQGITYFIDSFSIAGKHYISGVQRYKNTLLNKQPVSLYSEIIALDHPEAKTCSEYVFLVLDSLGLKNGLSQVEIILTDHGPYLVDVHPRISGANGINNKLFAHCGYATQLDLLIAASKNETIPSHNPMNYGRKVYLQNYYHDQRIDALNIALLYTLPSYREAMMIKTPGSLVSLPQNRSDAIGIVLLAHENPHQVEQDYQKLLMWQNSRELY